MKKIALFGIIGYSRYLSPLLHQLFGVKTVCRYEVTCSAYAKNAIEHYGLFKGSVLSLRRIINCQPYFNL